LRTQSSILGKVIKRRIDRNETTESFENIIIEANNELLAQAEVTNTRDSINTNLKNIFQKYPENKVGVQIERSKVESVVNLIKPFLPFDKSLLAGEGFSLWQNSLGFNNLIYIATILSDIEQRVQDDALSHYALLIEEPEAHLHPQLLLSLYNFLKTANSSKNSQLFITTHSPTLTSKIPLENLILLEKNTYKICNCFSDRGKDAIVQDTRTNKVLSNEAFAVKQKQLERYIDVTRSQLFYAKGILLVEGITEELLIPAFCQCLDYRLEDARIELVNVEGVSFYPFLSLFNSNDAAKNLPKPVAVITDNDRYTDSKNSIYAFDNLLENRHLS
jgi:putative ATP-dependent endonuclease of OLD family